ncbi:MAG: hypothetical protein PHX43_08455 [Alphaproteobacteria bacterium]|nr:hypothetical protein [Alphaproteobacteria bacterium]
MKIMKASSDFVVQDVKDVEDLICGFLGFVRDMGGGAAFRDAAKEITDKLTSEQKSMIEFERIAYRIENPESKLMHSFEDVLAKTVDITKGSRGYDYPIYNPSGCVDEKAVMALKRCRKVLESSLEQSRIVLGLDNKQLPKIRELPVNNPSIENILGYVRHKLIPRLRSFGHVEKRLNYEGIDILKPIDKVLWNEAGRGALKL